MDTHTRRQFLAAATAAALAPRLTAADVPAAAPSTPANPVAMATNKFSSDLYQQLAAKPGNVFYSPLSVEAALGMTAAGAKGETLEQMRKALSLTGDMSATHAGFKSLLAALNNEKVPAEKRGFQLSVANALWGARSYPWRKEFLTLTNEHYGAGLHEVDFSKAEAARAQINKWVEEQTREKIRDLLPPGSITEETRLVLTNAIYFKGKWLVEFDKKATKDGPFAHADGKKDPVPLMHKTGNFEYAESDYLQALQMAYIGKETAMLVLLPKKPDGLAGLEKDLTATGLDAVVKKLTPHREVQVTLPRFKVETEYDLIPPLKKLGMVDAFQAEKADFGGMNSGDEKLMISVIVHKAFVEVNEEGTEAAAATGVVAVPTSAAIPTVFRADRPFLFAIRHLPTNTILFFGKVENIK